VRVKAADNILLDRVMPMCEKSKEGEGGVLQKGKKNRSSTRQPCVGHRNKLIVLHPTAMSGKKSQIGQDLAVLKGGGKEDKL